MTLKPRHQPSGLLNTLWAGEHLQELSPVGPGKTLTRVPFLPRWLGELPVRDLFKTPALAALPELLEYP